MISAGIRNIITQGKYWEKAQSRVPVTLVFGDSLVKTDCWSTKVNLWAERKTGLGQTIFLLAKCHQRDCTSMINPLVSGNISSKTEPWMLLENTKTVRRMGIGKHVIQ